MRRPLNLSVIAAMALVVGACTGDGTAPSPTESITPTTVTTQPPTTSIAPQGSSSTSGPSTTTTLPIPRRGGSITMADDQEPPTLNPYVPGGDNLIVSVVGHLHMAGAWKIHPETSVLVPDLVTDIPSVRNGGVALNADGSMSVTWEVRPEARWSDGEPIDGDDFVFTLETLNQNDVYENLRADELSAVMAGATAIADGTRVTVTFPEPTLGYDMLFPWVIPRHAVEGSDFIDDWNATPWPAAGPFELVRWDRGEQMAFARNDAYRRTDELGEQLPYLDEIVVRFLPETEDILAGLRDGSLDVVTPPAREQEVLDLAAIDDQAWTLEIHDGPVWEHLSFWFIDDPTLVDAAVVTREVRREIAAALDFDKLATVGTGTRRMGSVLAGFSVDSDAAPWDLYVDLEGDPAEALAQVCAATDGCDGGIPGVTVVYNPTRDWRSALNEEVAAQLREAGLEADAFACDSQVDCPPFSVPAEMREFAWVGTPGSLALLQFLELFDPDQPCTVVEQFPATVYDCGDNVYHWGTESSVNRGDPAVAAYRELLAAARAAVDADELARLAIEAERLLAEEAVILPISYRPQVTGHSSRLFGVVPHRHGHTTWNAAEWWVSEG